MPMWRWSQTTPTRVPSTVAYYTVTRLSSRPKPLRISVFVESKNDSERLNSQEHQPWYNQILMWNIVCFSHAYLNIRAWHHAKQPVSRLKSRPEIGRRASDRPVGEHKQTITKLKSNHGKKKKKKSHKINVINMNEWLQLDFVLCEWK